MLMSIILLVVIQNRHRQQQEKKFTNSCHSLDSKSFASERVHGVILRDGAIVTVRLKGEKNFSPPGGHIEANETADAAMIRELKEELNIQVSTQDFKPYKTYCEVMGATKTQRTHLFFVEKWRGTLQVKADDQLRWVTGEFVTNSSSDTELIKLLNILKTDKLLR